MRINSIIAEEFEGNNGKLWITKIVFKIDNNVTIQKEFPVKYNFNEEELRKANHEIKDFIREVIDSHHFFRGI